MKRPPLLHPPTGTITFLFSDIEGSSKLWERQPTAMRSDLAQHDRLLRNAFEENGGFIFKTVGDAFCVAFDAAQHALRGAKQAQRALHATRWECASGIKVRMALHTGTAELRDDDYFGQALNRVSRILASAHGGQVLLSLPTEELVRDHLSEGLHLRALGEHRLRDLARSEHLFQLTAIDLPSDFPPLRSLECAPNNLPLQLTSFVGREHELAEVKRLLGCTRLLTLTGSGGIGKTRLSLQAAAELHDQFPNGIRFAEFAAITDSGIVVDSVAAALDLRRESEQALIATLSRFICKKCLLLIFDNCEHVITASADLAEALLRTCPQLHILATSREPLGIAGERAWPLPPLSLPDHRHQIPCESAVVEQLTQFESVRLFLDRATAVSPSFLLSPDNLHLVAQICCRLDGIPLAIELAAARLRVLTARQIVERLDERFHLLTTGSRTAVPRQQTLRALIDWSHDLLSEPERTLFRRLAAFAQGRTLEAIEAVCAGDDLQRSQIMDLLARLVDKSLVQVEKPSQRDARYFMLESIWGYASEKLAEAGEHDHFRRRHLDYFAGVCDNAAPHLLGPKQWEYLERMAFEETNLRYAVETSLNLPGEAAKGLRLWTSIERYIEVRGHFREGRAQLDKLLAHPENAARDSIRAYGLAAAGRLAWVADDMPEAHTRHSEALTIFRELGDLRGVAQALADLAFLALDTQDLPCAAILLDEAVSLADQVADARLTAHVQHVRAVLCAVEGNFVQALALEVESLAIYLDLDDAWQWTILAWGVGVNAMVLGQHAMSREHLAQSLSGGLVVGNRWGMTYQLDAFATLAIAERDFERAARLFGASETQRTRLGLVPHAPEHPALKAVMTAAPDLTGSNIEAARCEGLDLGFDAAVALALHSDSFTPTNPK